jgi:transposase InsO family protein
LRAVVEVVTGAVVFEATVSADSGGYKDALALVEQHAHGRRAFAIEGTGSFGAGLTGQYTSIAMGRTLRDSKIMASVGSKGDPWDSACAESCISTIKNELVKRRTFATRDQARLALFRYIESFYNPLRRHSSLEMLSPNDYEARYWEDNAAAAAA